MLEIFNLVLNVVIIFTLVCMIIGRKEEKIAEFKVLKPVDSMKSELGRSVRDFNRRFSLRKLSSYPSKYKIPKAGSWGSDEEEREVFCGILEQAGWKVWQNEKCEPDEVRR